MIGLLKGKPIQKKPTEIILDVNGVGYILNISVNTYDKISSVDDDLMLYTYLVVREDALDLYGFAEVQEKEMFQLLISISGVGPKLALGILSGIQSGALREAIMMNNVSTLVAIPGIGKKTAERLIIELKDKVNKMADKAVREASGISDARGDAVAALVSLGYKLPVAEKTVNKIFMENNKVSLEEIIKLALSQLNR